MKLSDFNETADKMLKFMKQEGIIYSAIVARTETPNLNEKIDPKQVFGSYSSELTYQDIEKFGELINIKVMLMASLSKSIKEHIAEQQTITRMHVIQFKQMFQKLDEIESLLGEVMTMMGFGAQVRSEKIENGGKENG